MVSNQKVPLLINAEIEQTDRMGGLKIFTGYSVIFIVFGSNCDEGLPKSVYQTAPSFTMMYAARWRPREIVFGETTRVTPRWRAASS